MDKNIKYCELHNKKCNVDENGFWDCGDENETCLWSVDFEKFEGVKK